MTLFKDLKQGFPIYILDTKNISVSQGRVSMPPSKPYFNTAAPLNRDMMVDVTVQVDGETRTYTFKDSTDAGYDNTKNQVISTGRELIIRELESMRTTSEQAMKDVERHKLIIEKCTSILSEFDPSEKEKREMDDRMTRIEESNSQITKMLSQILQNQRKANETDR